MTIKHLRVFTEVYQQMHISHAAEQLHMTQPAVSRSIQELEKYYGIHLFERIKHRLYRTQSGDELYAQAVHIIESFDTMETAMRNRDECGTLRVGASITIGNFFLPPVVKEFQQNHPYAQVKVTISNTETIANAILDNKVDVAIVEGTVTSSYIHDKHLGEDIMVLILPPLHPLTTVPEVRMRDIVRYPLLLREPGSAGRTYLNHVFASHEITLEPRWESTSTQALVKAVAYNIGISILPKQLVLQDLKAGVITTQPVADEAFVRSSHLIWHRQKYLTRTAKEFIAMCQTSSSLL